MHKNSMLHHHEQIAGGVRSGLMKEGDEVVWKAKHLFKKRMLRVRLTQMQAPHFFVDEQVEGDFALMKHEHYFEPFQNGVLMTDHFRFETPYGVLGRLVNILFLKHYMTRLLTERNAYLKKVAESSLWKQFLIQ